MPIAPLPTPLQDMAGRRFAFYPPVRNIEHNEWLYRRATWSECVVMNMRSGAEIPVPRRFLGEISGFDEPVMIVSLNRELAWKDGVVVPRETRVIELPVAVNDQHHESSQPARLAPVVSIRLESEPETRAWRWLGVAVVLGVVAFTIVADIARQAQSHQRPDFFHGYRSYLQLNSGDDYPSVISKLGIPSATRSADAGGEVFRILTYAARRYSVVLASPDQQSWRYIGTLDTRGRVLDAVQLPDGSTSAALLKSVPLF
jgi:hypothetical protein